MIERMSFLRITFLMGAIAFSLLLQVEAIAQSAGHRVSGNQVTISGRSQWDNWSFPDGTAVISPTGEVRAQKIEKKTNAVLDIVEYLRYNPPASIGKKEIEEICATASSNSAQIITTEKDIVKIKHVGPIKDILYLGIDFDFGEDEELLKTLIRKKINESI